MISSIGSGTTALALKSLTATTTRPTPPDPQEMFNRLDTDGDGKVTLTELQEGAPPARDGAAGSQTEAGAGPPSPEQMLSDLDGDGDGAVSYEEFAAWRPAEPPSGPPPEMMASMASGSIDLAALFGTDEQESSSLLRQLA